MPLSETTQPNSHFETPPTNNIQDLLYEPKDHVLMVEVRKFSTESLVVFCQAIPGQEITNLFKQKAKVMTYN